jgi:hypothetical protein
MRFHGPPLIDLLALLYFTQHATLLLTCRRPFSNYESL